MAGDSYLGSAVLLSVKPLQLISYRSCSGHVIAFVPPHRDPRRVCECLTSEHLPSLYSLALVNKRCYTAANRAPFQSCSVYCRRSGHAKKRRPKMERDSSSNFGIPVRTAPDSSRVAAHNSHRYWRRRAPSGRVGTPGPLSQHQP